MNRPRVHPSDRPGASCEAHVFPLLPREARRRYAYTFLWSSEAFTLPVGLAQLIVGDIQPWVVLMAASPLTAVPVIVIYMLGQRFMIGGLTAGSVTG